MTAAFDAPIPADLVFDEPPLTDADLERWEASVLELADDASMDISDAALELADSSDDDEVKPSPVRRWQITDDGAAEWALRKIAALEAEQQSVDDRYSEWSTRIDVWRHRSIRPLEARLAFFRQRLVDYARRQREATGKATVSLPSGKVSSRRQAAAVVVVDESAVIAWARANLDADAAAAVVKVVESVRVSDLREHVKIAPAGQVVAAGGEIVPGVEVRPESVSFTVSAQ